MLPVVTLFAEIRDFLKWLYHIFIIIAFIWQGKEKTVSGNFIIITHHYYAGLDQTRKENVYVMGFA